MDKEIKTSEKTDIAGKIMAEVATPEPIYVKGTGKIIAKTMGISEKTWYAWKKSEDFAPIEKPDGWLLSELLTYKGVRKHKDNRKKGIVISEGRQKKLEIEVKILTAKHRKQIGELIEYQEHQDEMVELLQHFTTALDFFSNETRLVRDERLLKIAETIRDRTILRLKNILENKVESSSSSEDKNATKDNKQISPIPNTKR